jgi:hypothetical protein
VRGPVLNVAEVAPLMLFHVLPSMDDNHWIVPV